MLVIGSSLGLRRYVTEFFHHPLYFLCDPGRKLIYFSICRHSHNLRSDDRDSFYALKARCKKIRLLFLGSDNFSIKSLEAVAQVFSTRATINVVVSNTNNLLGEYVKQTINDNKGREESNLFQLFHWKDFRDRMLQKSDSESFEFDLGVVASFGHLIPSKVIHQCQMGILNVHGSLLPRWRGASPTAAAILHGDHVTGISIMKIEPHRFDVGPILHKLTIPLNPHIRTPELTSLLATLGASALKEVLQNLPKFLSNALPQNEAEATKAPKLTQEMGHVQWSEQSALEIYNLFRGLSGRYKLRTSYQGRIVDLDEFSIYSRLEEESSDFTTSNYNYPFTVSVPLSELENYAQVSPGYILFSHNLLCVRCRHSSNEISHVRNDWIFIRKLKIQHKWITAKDFKNGWLSKHGASTDFNSLKTVPSLSEQLQKI